MSKHAFKLTAISLSLLAASAALADTPDADEAASCKP